MAKIIFLFGIFLSISIHAETNWKHVSEFLDMPRGHSKFAGIWLNYPTDDEMVFRLNKDGTGILCMNNGYAMSAYELNYYENIWHTVDPKIKFEVIEIDEDENLTIEQNKKRIQMRPDPGLYFSSENCSKLLK